MTKQPDVVVAVADSVRADHVSLGAADLETTPELDRIAADGCSFPNCFSHGTGTAASVASLLTGVTPSVHQVAMGEYVGTIPDELRTVPEALSAAGYETVCVTDNPRVRLIGADDAFDRFVEVSRSTLLRPQNVPLVARWLSEYTEHTAGATLDGLKQPFSYFVTRIATRLIERADSPVFAYVHYNDPHRPDHPAIDARNAVAESRGLSVEECLSASAKIHERSEAYNAGALRVTSEEWRGIEAMYDAEIAYTDGLIGALYDAVDDQTLFAVTADHGELLGEHGAFSHGEGLVSDEETHVPLVVTGVDGLSGRDDRLVQHADLVATVASAAGATLPRLEGSPLATVDRTVAVSQDFVANYDTYADANESFERGPRRLGVITAVRTPEYKLVRSAESPVVYELPAEGTDVSDREPDVLRELQSAFAEWNAEHGTPVGEDAAPDDYDEATKERLRRLGYRE